MVDLVVLAAGALAALGGWRDGLVTGVLVLGGWLAGGMVGLLVFPALIARLDISRPMVVALIQIFSTLACALLGGSVMSALAARVGRFTGARRPLRLADSVAGALASVLVAACLVWSVATVVRPLLPPAASRQVAQSRSLGALDHAMPLQARSVLAQARRTLGQSQIPSIIDGLSPEPVVPVAPPDTADARTAGVRRAAGSVMKVTADEPACDVVGQGSGWVVAHERVVTNAHVVQGGQTMAVQVTGQGRRLLATVVAFDRRLDLAILAVPGLQAPPLSRSQGGLPAGAPGVVVGFPRDAGYTVRAARVRSTINAVDSNDTAAVSRQVYALRAVVQPGNSGGPFLTPAGRVAGTVFAKGVDDASTAYALTDRATDALLDRAASLTRPVGVGECS